MAQPLAPNPSVYVGNLDPQVTEQTLYDHFVRIGPVMSVRVCVDTANQKSLGYGYVNFQNPADAEKALDELNFTKLLTKHIRVAKIQRDPSQRRSGVNNIVVKRLPANMDVPALKEIFSKFGRITSMKLAADETGAPRGYAYLSYDKEDSAVEAVQEVNNMEIDGKAILVERYQPQFREEQQRQFTNLFVRNLSPAVSDEAFNEFFAKFGTITSFKIRRLEDPAVPTCGYVAFGSHEEAAKAIEELNEKESEIAAAGTQLAVARFQSRSERSRARDRQRREKQLAYSKYPNLYVKNFDDNISSEQLRDLFETRAGNTISVRVMFDPVTKVSRCFGFVSMKDNAAAQKAIAELYGSTFLGPRPLFVTYAVKRDVRRQALEEMQRKSNSRVRNFGGDMGPGMNMGPGRVNFPPMMHAGNMGFPNGPMMNRGGPMGQMPMQRNFGGGMGQMPMGMPQQAFMQQNGGMRNMPNPGMMRPQAPVRPMMQAPMMQQQQQQQPQQQSLSAILASMNPEQQKNVLGERLYNYILRKNPAEAAKVTGMLLEMDNSEILNLLDTSDLLDGKISEALEVLQRHSAM
ncbi:RNA-binding protein, putative [Bodo saltans]|uniref:Polyadenylate-binding protein n=1 Tax=Bodo saltans TaxID=75058 RepID=A0A0S4IKZ4_BODSA|nr:RNA-binding protein, putative [Bodo saltans]|eukprot:CUE67444.1 RNA-binding protein, putative [Bodo saltans]